jgi:predicted transcriptional regulator
MKKLLPFSAKRLLTNAEARALTGNSDGSVKLLLRKLSEKGIIVAIGETRERKYRLRQ